MTKIIPLSLIAALSLSAAEIQLNSIGVESTMLTDVAENAQVSADLAQALSTKIPSVDMVRRSGIANDILIRGQKRDNISIEVDGTKIYGACPNRMDPPTSHILANQIETIEVTEGPYDVETFGVMSGGVKITTKAPTKEFHGEVTGGVGSWGYQKVGFTASGGNDIVRMLISGSMESSEQYEDGNGDNFAEQIKNNPAAPVSVQYQDEYADMDAYDKKSVMAKAFVTVTENQELRLSVTANRSGTVLYPNSKMDALYDDSNVYSIEYNVKNLGDVYKNLNIQYYASDVDHPMGTDYRKSSEPANKPVMTNWLTTDMQGLKLKNTFDIADSKLLLGLDGSQRVWDGHYEINHMAKPWKSIDNAQTDNLAVFAKLDKTYGAFDVSYGARYDTTDITNDAGLQNNSYNALNANVITTYNLTKNSKVFLGIGQAYRVPDARELYFTSVMSHMPPSPMNPSSGKVVGTDTLDQTRNREIDLGYETSHETFTTKIKAFYSDLSNYIYIEKGANDSAFQNIDATVYGAELSAEYFASDDITIDAGVSYKRGKKDQALAGQTDTDLADMAPLRAGIAATYEYANNSTLTAEVQASDTWDNVDSDNGEQVLDSWAVLNLKAKHAFSRNFEFVLGVNNLFNETYATSNTYADLTLVTGGSADGEVMLMNDPGRYLYTNLTYRF